MTKFSTYSHRLLTEREEETDREASKNSSVSPSSAEEALGTNSSPEDGRGEEGVFTGAGKLEGRFGCTNVLESELEVE